MGPFGQVYARLVEQGYSVLPIMPGTKKPGLPRNNNNEWMDFPRWPTFQSTLAHHRHWALSTAGIGVRCGLLSGYLVVVDIDTDDPGILEALRKILPPVLVKKRGARGESWFYYGPGVPSHSWKINGCKVVEILGTGRQTVIPPTIHPDLGEPYRWTGSKTLEDFRPQDLPLLPPSIVGQIDAVLVPFGYEPPAPRGRTSGDEIDAADDPHRRLNEYALDNLAAWVPDLNLYRCRPYRNGFEAVATWRESTKGRRLEDRNRNLKIVPNGIKDFGEDKGYTAIDLVMAAKECDLEAAFAFLDEHLEWSGGEPLLDIPLDISALAASATPKLEMLGLNDDDDSNGSSNESSSGSSNGSFNGNGADTTGMHTGASNGAHNGGSQASAQTSAQVIPFKPAAVVRESPFSDWKTYSEADDSESSSESAADAGVSTTDPLLEPLTYVPGRVGEIVDFIVKGARRPNRVLALAAAIVVVGTLIGRRARGPVGNATHLYPMIIAPSGGGKEWICNAIQILIEAAGAGTLLHPSEISVQGGLDEALLTMPVGVIIVDEIHYFLGRLLSSKAGPWEQSLIGQFNKLWGKSFDQYRTTRKVGKPPSIVHSPAISLFGASTPDDFWPLLQGTEISNGFFSRLAVFESLFRSKLRTPPVPYEVPAGLEARLTELHLFGDTPLKLAQLNDPNIKFDLRDLPWSNAGAEKVYQQLNDWVDCRIDTGAGRGEYFNRVVETAVRLATIRAAGIAGHQGAVDVDDMIWGADIASILVTRAIKQAQECSPQTPRRQLSDKLDDLIARRGSMTVREIQQYIRSSHRSSEITDILNQMAIAGRIVRTANGYAVPHKKTK